MRPRRLRPAPITRSAFAGFCFPPDAILLAVRWYLRFSLVSRHRGVARRTRDRGRPPPSTGGCRGSRRCWPRLPGRAAGTRWEVDETYVKVHAELDQGAYPKGVKVSDEELAAVPLRRHGWHGE
jgi:transposase, IS6 family